jgi:putative cell wall-binding protein
MKRLIAILVVLVLASVALTVAVAQDRADQASMVEQSRIYVEWMKAMAKKLSTALDQARREQNTRKIDCIEDRLNSLNKLIGESQGLNEKIRAFALQQRIIEGRKLFLRLDQLRQTALQLLQMVDDCYHSINENGGFVETIEEWLGDPDALPPGDPTGETTPEPAPEPLPNEFTPGPVSEE